MKRSASWTVSFTFRVPLTICAEFKICRPGTLVETGGSFLAQRAGACWLPGWQVWRAHSPAGEGFPLAGRMTRFHRRWSSRGPIPHSRFCPRRRFVITTGKEVSHGRPGLHLEKERVLRAQAHGSGKPLDRDLRLAYPGVHPTAVKPRPCQVRVERQRSIGEGGTVVEVADDESER